MQLDELHLGVDQLGGHAVLLGDLCLHPANACSPASFLLEVFLATAIPFASECLVPELFGEVLQVLALVLEVRPP